jgi:glycosyltransferase involved in cell wall biosynthesis
VLLKVLLVGKGAPDRGGIPSFLDTLLGGPLGRQHDLRFLNLAHTGTPEGGRATIGNLTRTVEDTFAVYRAARGCDVVHVHSALAPAVTLVRAGLLALAGRARGCAVGMDDHGGAVQLWLTNGWRRCLVRLMMRPVHRVVAVCRQGELALRAAVPPERVRLVDNGVRLAGAARREAAHGPPRVLYVGLLTARKGLLDLLAASRMLRERGVGHELRLVGGTPDEGPAAEAEVRAAVAGQAELLGTRPPEEMPAAYAEADVFCLPSWWEAMPLSVLEAMAGGLPVVATDVGDVARAVLDGETGFVVPPHAPEQLAAALEKLLVDAEQRRRMGTAGRAHVERHFSADATARSVSALYEELQRVRR